MTSQHPTPNSTPHPTIGGLLRSLRARRGWTLKQMSEHSGIPLSTLSKVEHDRLTLTYDKLLQLSQRLQLRMSELFAEQEDEAPGPAVTARRSIGRIDDAIRVTTPNYDYYYLCPELRRKRMIPVLTRVRAKTIEEFGELVRHSGEEYIHVLEGRMEVHTEFYDPIVLETGESVYIDSNMGHAYIAAEGCDEVLLLGVCSSADEALMESLLTLHGEEGASRKTGPRRLQAPAAKPARAGKPAKPARTPARKPGARK
ncbi:helix-turn-helix domain-containing protein [Pseudoxanthomonas sp. 10H]|uniref:helix-turn-helix domain-containing protein n=1 Tax=Pseudoxanthomonas sp. 10H TaxID=3242729 RepID=UPI00355837AD